MEIFYRKDNIEIFRRWVYYQIKNDTRLTLIQSDEQTYQIHYKNKVAKFIIWPMDIIEEIITEDEKVIFYLHFQFHSYHFAADFFRCMIIKLTEEEKETKKKILLCCTSGMTTNYLAEKVNSYCHLHQLPYVLSAVSIYGLEKVYRDYELVLVAPQLQYKMIELSLKYKPTVFQSIEPIIFATYDCQGVLKQINKFLKEGESHE